MLTPSIITKEKQEGEKSKIKHNDYDEMKAIAFLKASREIDGYDWTEFREGDIEALNLLINDTSSLDVKTIKQLHELLVEEGGSFRKNPKSLSNSHNWLNLNIIRARVDKLLPHMNKGFSGLTDKGLIGVCLYHHHRFLKEIMPFHSCNGVVARMLFFWQYLRSGGTDVYIFDPEHKEEYFKMFSPQSWRHNEFLGEDTYYGFEYEKFMRQI